MHESKIRARKDSAVAPAHPVLVLFADRVVRANVSLIGSICSLVNDNAIQSLEMRRRSLAGMWTVHSLALRARDEAPNLVSHFAWNCSKICIYDEKIDCGVS